MLRNVLVAVAVASAMLVGGTPAHATGYQWFEDPEGTSTWIRGEQVNVAFCWPTAGSSSFRVKYPNKGWKTVARSKHRRDATACMERSTPFLATYKWRIDTLAPRNANGRRLLTVGIYDEVRALSILTRVPMLATSEGPSATPPTAAPEPPAPAPTPAPALTAAPTPTPASSSTLKPYTDAQMQYSEYLFEQIRTNGYTCALNTCRNLQYASFARDFYDTAAFTGEQMYKMPYADARVAARLVFAIRCESSFGIKILNDA